jgi:tRNA(fMet)-specific endonuclease VapC
LSRAEQAAISAVTAGEILYGLTKVGPSAQRRKAIDLFLAEITIYPWDLAAAEAYGHVRAHQEAKGRPIGPYDLQIAAHAIALKAVLVTHDKVFRHVAGLAGLQDWARDVP